MQTVYQLNSILGKRGRLSVIGILAQREDNHYYLEDQTCSVRLNFTEMEFADPDAFFTENCVVLCEGFHANEAFMVTSMQHPPLYLNK